MDIPLTASTDLITEASGRTLVSWTPPNPGSIRLPKYHRYTYLLYRQRTELPDDVTITEQQKVNFDTRAFTDEQALKAVGVTFFRLAPNGAA